VSLLAPSSRAVPATRAAAGPVKLHLWLPWRALLVLLSPILLVLLCMFAVMLWVLRVNPLRTVTGVARLLWAVGGTDIRVEASRASILLKFL
jgi:hypothetical protein